MNDPDSVFSCYRTLVALRKKYPVFADGRFEMLLPDDEDIFAYTRENESEKLLVICNFHGKEIPCLLREEQEGMELLVSNYKEQSMDVLKPYEARMYILKK